MTDAITSLSAVALSTAIARRELSCVEVMQAHLARIAEANPVHNAIVELREEAALLDEARAADRELAAGVYRGRLHGMPHGVKDLADAAGLPTSMGSPIFAGRIAAADSLHVARIRAAGAILVGKTNVPEFGLGSQSYNSVFGVTRNALDPELTAGGSSGGAAVALATRMLPSADGSDMMGSLRNPAAFNGVVGFRPSQGRVPSYPAEDVFFGQLAVNGPMGRTVADTIRQLCTIAGPDPRTPLTIAEALPEPAAFRPAEPAQLRIGWLADLDGYLAMEPGVLERCEAALAGFSAAGAVIEPVALPFDPARLWACWLVLRQFGVCRLRPLYEDDALRAQLKPELCWELEQGLALSAGDVAAAGAVRSQWFAAVAELFGRYDLLALPAAQVFPFPAEVHWPDRIDGRTMDTYHRWMEVVVPGTLAGLPVVALPAGVDGRGRAAGLQFMGAFGRDREVLEAALAYEALTAR
ncbi:MAG: amidase [Pseudomonadales bacterium]|jgi:amidase|nr:amidase [Pseudomonadales bacterium]